MLPTRIQYLAEDISILVPMYFLSLGWIACRLRRSLLKELHSTYEMAFIHDHLNFLNIEAIINALTVHLIRR